MSVWIGLGFVALLCLMGLIDLRHGRHALARALGAPAILGAAALAGWATWGTLVDVRPLDASLVLVGAGGAMLLGLISDGFGDLRTRSYTAAATVSFFALLLPSSVGETPRAGAVLFVGVLSIALGSLSGALVRKVTARVIYDDDDDDDDPNQATSA